LQDLDNYVNHDFLSVVFLLVLFFLTLFSNYCTKIETVQTVMALKRCGEGRCFGLVTLNHPTVNHGTYNHATHIAKYKSRM